jgi:hypothetical protein
MMGRIKSLTLIALVSLSSIACNKQGVTEKQKEMQATEEAKNLTSQGQQQFLGARAAAEKTVSAARADFETTRENYLHARRLDLIDLDRRIGDLEATPTTGAKTDVRARLSAIDAQREAFGRHMAFVETATPATWDAATKKLDQEWDSLKRAVDAAG